MVKIVQKGAQDPADPSLQMKVQLELFRFANILLWEDDSQLSKNPIPRSTPFDSSPAIMLLPNPNSGTTSAGSSKPKAHRDKSSPLMRSFRGGPTTSRLLALFCATNPELATTTCIRSTGMSRWMVRSASCIRKWPATIVLLQILSRSSGLLSSTRKTRSGGQGPTSSETASSNSQF